MFPLSRKVKKRKVKMRKRKREMVKIRERIYLSYTCFPYLPLFLRHLLKSESVRARDHPWGNERLQALACTLTANLAE